MRLLVDDIINTGAQLGLTSLGLKFFRFQTNENSGQHPGAMLALDKGNLLVLKNCEYLKLIDCQIIVVGLVHRDNHHVGE